MSAAHETDPFAADLAAVITGLLRLRGLDRTDAIRTLGISQGTWYNRLSDGLWTAPQMAKLADLLDVEVGRLYSGPDELVQKLKFLKLINGSGPEYQPVLPFDRPTPTLVHSANG